MRTKENEHGFTILEVVIVIIIVGVLAGLALPRVFKTVEFAKGVEALASLSAVRQAMERCYVPQNTYVPCDDFSDLYLEDPGTASNAHFSYSFVGVTATTYTLRATRNTLEGGAAGDQINLIFDGTTVTRSGTSAFSSLQ